MRKILVIQTASIGDVILATALLEKLSRFFPDSRIDFLVKKGMESLFDGDPVIHRLLIWDKSKKIRSFFQLLAEIRKTRYDLVINLQRYMLTGLLTAFSNGKKTIGFDKNPLSRFFHKKIPHEIRSGIHEIQRNQKLIEELTDPITEKPRLYPPPLDPLPNKEGEISKIENRKSKTYYTISPASLWFTKQFPAEKWVELVGEIPEETTVYLLGSKADVALCESIRVKARGIRHQASGIRHQASGIRHQASGIRHQASGIRHQASGIQNLAGQLTLLESAALMQGAKMNFTNDSAPMHLASAVNAPVTVVYCSTSPDFGFGPLSDNSAIAEIREPLYCRPCGLHGRAHCPEGHFRCAFEIDMDLLKSRL